MRNVFIVFSVALIFISVFASFDKPFREEDMLIANMEEPIGVVQPNWATDSLNVRGVGIVPYFADAYDVFVVDTIAYVCMNNKLVIFNIKDQSNPILLSYLYLSGLAYDVYISGSYAYVADYGSGLHIINISNPASPAEVGYYDTQGYARGVYVSGSYAYVAIGYSGLRIINISDPSSPNEVGYYDTSGEAFGVYVAGDYTYLAASDFYILDFALTGVSEASKRNSYQKNIIMTDIRQKNVKYNMLTSENEFSVYDKIGNLVYKTKNQRIGYYEYNTEYLSSGIYFIRFKDGEKEINKKMVIIK